MDIKNIEDFIVAKEHDFHIIERVKSQTELDQIKTLILKHKGIFVSQENILKDLNFKEMLVMLDAKCGTVYAHNLYTDCIDVRVVWLPRPGVDGNNQKSSAVGIIHSGRHPNIYVSEVNRGILLVPEGLPTEAGRQQIITIIDNLKNKLYNSAKTSGDWYNVLNEDNENDL